MPFYSASLISHCANFHQIRKYLHFGSKVSKINFEIFNITSYSV